MAIRLIEVAKAHRPLLPTSAGTYICVLPDLNSKLVLTRLARLLDIPFPEERLEDLHSTIMYSKGCFPSDFSVDPGAEYSAKIKDVQFWDGHDGDGYLVVILDSPDLQECHSKWVDRGLKHSFDDYTPHVTLIDKLEFTPELKAAIPKALPKVFGRDLLFKAEVLEGIKSKPKD